MKIKVLLPLIAILTLSGCATQKETTYITPANKPTTQGIHHKVLKGQTLWSIAKAYNVDINELTKSNPILETCNISEGQLIFIPGAKREVKIKPLTSMKWSKLTWPVKGSIISYFGSMMNNTVNKGIDISTSKDQDVVASHRGKIVFIGKSLPGYGNTIMLTDSSNIVTVYSNVNNIFKNLGQSVGQGETIGSINAGDALHFEVRQEAIPVNPLSYLL